jgi:tripartite-type tricarboxylate transporter receptor subunit TctC
MKSASRLLRRGLLAAALLAAAGAALAQPPDHAPIRLLVGFPPGAGSDTIARTLADKLETELGTSIVVENRGGAGGQIAAIALKTAAPDGHTLFISHDHTIAILPQVIKNPGFDPATDFTPVAGFATFANVLAVSGATPAATLPQYVHWVQQTRGGKDTIGVPAPGSIPVFLVQLIGQKYGLDLQSAPYRGSTPMISDLMGGQINAAIGSVPDLIQYQRDGKVHIVAAIGARRDPLLPKVPTFTELGFKNLSDYPWYGFFAPAGTPQPFIDKFGAALQKVLAMPDVRQRLTDLGLNVAYEPQARFAARVRGYTQTWKKIIHDSGFKPQ